MGRETGLAYRSPQLQAPGYRLHSRIRIAAVAISILLIIIEVMLARKIPERPYSGIILNNLSVARVAGGSPGEAAGLRKSDEVLTVNGLSCQSLRDVSECMSRIKPGDTVQYGILRQGNILTLPITFVRPPRSEIVRKTSLIVVGFSFLTIGLLVYFKRGDKLALIFYLLCFAFGLVLVNVVNFELWTVRHAYKAAFYDLLVLVLPALFVHFFLLFPEKAQALIRSPRMEYAVYVPAILLFAVSEFFNVMIFSYGRTYTKAIAAFQNVTAAYFIIFIILGLVAFWKGYRHVKAEVIRKKLRLVVWGTIVGILPLVFVHVVVSIEPNVEIPGEKFVFLPLILVPVAFGHAIVRYGLMDLEIVVKRSLVYTLLTAALASIYFIVVYGIGRLVSRFVGSADLLFSIASIFVITLLISPLRKHIRSTVDRTFFREEYNYRKILKQISHSLAGMVSLDSLASYLCIRTAEVLNASTTAIFLMDEKSNQHTARYGVHVDHTMLKGFSSDGPLCKYMEKMQSTLNVERKLASNRPLPISDEEAEMLFTLKSAIVVPFLFKSNLLGFISIGIKRSDDFYSSTDVELLETLCDQVSLAIENTNLYLETVEKQKMEKELEVAKEIQRRFLPKSFPAIPGLATHAMNIPSKHVGGDYYDIIPLGATRIAIVIADVSGKGVPAALLMASLQSSLRAEADAHKQPYQVISTLNRVIYEHTSGDTFVTIFYGLIDFEAAALTYCNAGQTPPIVMSKDLSSKMLDETDIVIGIDSGAQYKDTTLPLREGDLIFLYTDGITDELDEADEPYGERRLLDELRQANTLALSNIVQRVYEAVMAHTHGNPQDDLTALAIRIDSLVPAPTKRSTQRNI
jgi:sigma-B regulation protein RsbU (phosphoserine phosphatase)